MKQIIFATNNKHKLQEIRSILKNKIKILSLKDINFNDQIPETQSTIEGNSRQKAWFIHNLYKKDVFADDTGLEVDALNGEPGVYSARYAGENQNFEKNMLKLLKKMKDKENRKARFRTVITLIIDNKEYQFEGIVNGTITTKPIGNNGFGYDPIFLPDGYKKTFAQMTLEEKNKISHRAIATQKLINFLNNYLKNKN